MNEKTSKTVVVILYLHTLKRLFDCSVLLLLFFLHFLLCTPRLFGFLILFQFSILVINLFATLIILIAFSIIHADQFDMALLIQPRFLLAHEEKAGLGAKHQGHADGHG